MKKNKLFVLALTVISLLSCSKDDNTPAPMPAEGAYADGIFVLNEGNFGSGNSTVSYLSEDLSEIEHNIFSSNNNGDQLGDTATDIGFFEDLAFVVMNVSNKIEVVDRNTWESLATISTDLQNPRKIAFSSGKAYVTNWGDGANPDDDYVAVFDLSDLSLVRKIEVEEGPDEILASGNNIFVAHAGGFGFNKIVSVINPVKDILLQKIEVGDVPNSMLVHNGSLWVLSGGKPFYAEGGETAGSITKISIPDMVVVETYEFEDVTDHPAHLNLSDGALVYSQGNQLYRFFPEEGLPERPFLELQEVEFLYGLQVRNNRIFASAPNSDFSGNGNLYIYDLQSGELNASFATGINPSGVYFGDE